MAEQYYRNRNTGNIFLDPFPLFTNKSDFIPVVVIDPEEGNDFLRRVQEQFGGRLNESVLVAIEGALRSMIQPKPQEPTGLGAVVKDDEGNRWVRVTTDSLSSWKRSDKYGDAHRRAYSQVNAVEVLSPGVQS